MAMASGSLLVALLAAGAQATGNTYDPLSSYYDVNDTNPIVSSYYDVNDTNTFDPSYEINGTDTFSGVGTYIGVGTGMYMWSPINDTNPNNTDYDMIVSPTTSPTSAPTAPTSAPTSPTSAPTAPTSAPTALPAGATLSPTAGPTLSPTASPTPAPPRKITVKSTSMQVDSFVGIDADTFQTNVVAAATPAGATSSTTASYLVSSSMSIVGGDLSNTELSQTTCATTFNVEVSKVNRCTLQVSRRLESVRHLTAGTSATMTVTTSDPTAAETIATSARDTSGTATRFFAAYNDAASQSGATGLTTLPTVSDPVLSVVMTAVFSQDVDATSTPALPSDAAIATEMETVSGRTISSVVTETGTVSPTSSPTHSPTSSPTHSPTHSPTAPATPPMTAGPTHTPTPAPTDAPATPTPTEAPATPTPTDAPATPTPTDAPATPTPTDAPATPTPTDAPATPTPTDAPATPAPTTASAANTTAGATEESGAQRASAASIVAAVALAVAAWAAA